MPLSVPTKYLSIQDLPDCLVVYLWVHLSVGLSLEAFTGSEHSDRPSDKPMQPIKPEPPQKICACSK